MKMIVGLSLISIIRLKIPCRLSIQGVEVWLVNTVKNISITFASSVTFLLKSVHDPIRCYSLSFSLPTAIVEIIIIRHLSSSLILDKLKKEEDFIANAANYLVIFVLYHI